MRYLLDTNVLSDARRRASKPLEDWLESQFVDDLTISSITVFELEHGVRLVERRDQQQGLRLRAWLEDSVLSTFAGRILPVDDKVALAAAEFHAPDPMSLPDSLIAATAHVHGLAVVTRNVHDFERTGVPLMNPWDQ